jgi:hypothetical protein
VLQCLICVFRSLSALNDVLIAIGEKKAHVPYRNSVLTRLLQDSIGGNSKMMLILTVSPEPQFSAQTSASLSFAVRARSLVRSAASKNKPKGKN